MASAEAPDTGSAARPRNNAVTASVPGDWTPAAESNSTPFSSAVERVLHLTAELARNLVGAHQGAATLIVSGDWAHARKYFSLSTKYAEWFAYRAPAVGFGLHAVVVAENQAMRLTEGELESHPQWKGFGRESAKHPPMRGWLAVPLIGEDGRNYGLLQLSDKYDDADFTADDEAHLTQLAALTSSALDALCKMHDEQRLGTP